MSDEYKHLVCVCVYIYTRIGNDIDNEQLTVDIFFITREKKANNEWEKIESIYGGTKVISVALTFQRDVAKRA